MPLPRPGRGLAAPTPLTGPLLGLTAYHALGALVGAEQCVRQLLSAGWDPRFRAPDLVSLHATAAEAAVLALCYAAVAALLWWRYRVALPAAAVLAVAGLWWWVGVRDQVVALQLVALVLLVLPGARRPLVRRLRERMPATPGV